MDSEAEKFSLYTQATVNKPLCEFQITSWNNTTEESLQTRNWRFIRATSETDWRNAIELCLMEEIKNLSQLGMTHGTIILMLKQMADREVFLTTIYEFTYQANSSDGTKSPSPVTLRATVNW